ncbi:MAG: hypothetical protein Q7T16_06660 [Candidatus Burarchaeum sp.]|nr:hypothetical protein [Candidatus Burarchaeum sp.]MDO8340309.1 hypothetical protein [Candidatus Burarchaeum sp.]
MKFGKPKGVMLYLEKILGTSTKIAVLGVLVNNPEKSYFEKELANAAGAAVSETNRQMSELVGSGLVRLERTGKVKLYSINKSHFLVPSLKRLFRDLNAVYRDAADKICRFAVSSDQKLEAVILIGSVAKGNVKSDLISSPSDIDLIFIIADEHGKERLFDALISYINGEIVPVYGVVCYPILLTKNEYVARLEKKDGFIMRAQTEGVELHGRKPRRFG